jgi:anaerobic selenocysteine-containing dehydrogenase
MRSDKMPGEIGCFAGWMAARSPAAVLNRAPYGEETIVNEIRHTVCRVCHASCGLLVQLSDGEPTKIHGNKNNSTFEGYSCIKGREMPSYRSSPDRLLHSVAKLPDGTHSPIATEEAMDRIASKLDAIVKTYGPNAVACYSGTQGYQNVTANRFLRAFMGALKSPMFFDTTTIDQPGKTIASTVHGKWSAGGYNCEDADVWLLIGNNPLVSMMGGFSVNPAAQLRRAQARGLRVIVIDPRRTEVARKADLFLQPRPGHSGPILAAMLKIILDEGLHDAAFVAEHVSGFERLRATVDLFDPKTVAEAADIAPADLYAAARMYGNARRAAANLGTGPNMSGHCSVNEYLALSLMTVCGHWRRAGEVQPNPGALVNPLPAVAEALPGRPARVEGGTRMHVRGLGQTTGGIPTGALADEILLDDEAERIRALIVLGGNPVMAIPDQLKTVAALQRLDLLVCIDPVLGATARYADFVIAPKLSLEIITTSINNELLGASGLVPGWGFLHPYAQWADPAVAPPAGSDLIEEWEFFYGLAQRLGLELSIPSLAFVAPPTPMIDVDMVSKPTSEALWERLFEGSPVPLSEIRAQHGGGVYRRAPEIVRPSAFAPDQRPRLNVGDEELMTELAAIPSETRSDNKYRYSLISRRLHNVHNSCWHKAPNIAKREPHNAAYMHPSDLAGMGLAEGGPIEIISARSSIEGFAVPSDDIRRGTISLAHSWGDVAGTPDEANRYGSNTSRLIFNDRDFDPLTGIPRMSNIPVDVRPRHAAPDLSERQEDRPRYEKCDAGISQAIV